MEKVGAEQLHEENSVFVCEKENEEKDAVRYKSDTKRGRWFPLPKGRLTEAERVRALSIKGLE